MGELRTYRINYTVTGIAVIEALNDVDAQEKFEREFLYLHEDTVTGLDVFVERV